MGWITAAGGLGAACTTGGALTNHSLVSSMQEIVIEATINSYRMLTGTGAAFTALGLASNGL